MKETIIKVFWGIILICMGGLVLAAKLESIDLDVMSDQMWSAIFAGFSLAFFVSYFVSGIRRWGWLFPALTCAALALVFVLNLIPGASPYIASVVLASIAIPFYVGYLVDRRHWGLLIPAWILTVVCFIPTLSELIDENVIGSIFLYGIALPFLVVFGINRTRKWALITGSVLAIIGTLPLIEYLQAGEIQGSIVMFLFTIPFLVTFFMSPKAWWALIPAGCFASIGVVAIAVSLLPPDTFFMIGGLSFGSYSSILMLGIAITFGILWMLRSSRPTGWAIYPAVGFLIIALVTSILSRRFDEFIPALILTISGAALILAGLLKPRGRRPVEP
ncbi:MAG: hypothetical protein C3F13_18335 [Anaerolineales bacterium]|nr:hypothetical protein [Anaerolineae bacterium]PWB49797.1 MAG: hypothetical protein C3F13_18335 [Anaerolineales bacterium]